MTTNNNIFLLGDIAELKNECAGAMIPSVKSISDYQPLINIQNKKFIRRGVVSVTANRSYYNIKLYQYECLGEIYFKDYSNIKKIQLQIGGQLIDSIEDNNIIQPLQKLYNMEGIPFFILKQMIPYLAFHNISVIFELYKDDELSYNVYEHKYLNNNEQETHFIFQNQFSNDINIGCKIRLTFNHIVYILLVKTEPYSKIKSLILNDLTLQLNLNESNNGYDIYYLTFDLLDENSILKYGIKFSRIDKCIIEFENQDPKEVSIHVINSNIFRIISNMGGLAFCA